MKWYRVELHTHTIASDGIMDPEELAKRGKKRNYDAIVVTDHNTTTSCNAVAEKGKKVGLVVVPGIESHLVRVLLMNKGLNFLSIFVC